MNEDPRNLQTLLDDLLPAGADRGGPDRSTVLAMLRRERSRRLQARLVGAAAVTVLAVMFLFWRSAPPAGTPVAMAPPLPSPAIVVHDVDDQQLFAALENTPAALVEWPNGERTLLVVSH